MKSMILILRYDERSFGDANYLHNIWLFVWLGILGMLRYNIKTIIVFRNAEILKIDK